MPWYRKLVNMAVTALTLALSNASVAAEPEKEELKFGFIKLTDMPPPGHCL